MASGEVAIFAAASTLASGRHNAAQITYCMTWRHVEHPPVLFWVLFYTNWYFGRFIRSSKAATRPAKEAAMPNISQPTGQDWDAVNVGRGGSSSRAPKTAREVSLMKAAGKLSTEKR